MKIRPAAAFIEVGRHLAPHQHKHFILVGGGHDMRSVDVTIPVSADESVSGVLDGAGRVRGRPHRGRDRRARRRQRYARPAAGSFHRGPRPGRLPRAAFQLPLHGKGPEGARPAEKLIRTWQAAFEFVRDHPEFGTPQIVAAGKSMGGRIASQMAADGQLPAKALVFLGYPLHPPGRKDQLRDAHLYRIEVPMLFFAGTRDTLCDLELLKPVAARLKAPAVLELVEGGDHSFILPRSLDISEDDVTKDLRENRIVAKRTIAS